MARKVISTILGCACALMFSGIGLASAAPLSSVQNGSGVVSVTHVDGHTTVNLSNGHISLYLDPPMPTW